MIAMGLALEPELLIADEPTTALDVTVQAQVLKLLREIRDTHGTAILFITHDLGVIAELCDWVYVMYAGAVLEQGPVGRLFAQPAHPYTQMLLRATPTVRTVQAELLSIPGQIPQPFELPAGCRFADRCPHRFERCASEPPHLHDRGRAHGALLAAGIARRLRLAASLGRHERAAPAVPQRDEGFRIRSPALDPRASARRRRGQRRAATRRDPGHRRRVRVGQVDAPAHGAAAGPPEQRRRAVRGPQHRRARGR